MLIKVLVVSMLIILFPVSSSRALAEDKLAENPIPEVVSDRTDLKVKILAEYFAKYKSSLEPYAQDFIDASKKYEIDWKLVPAISGVESTFGKFIPGGTSQYSSYNAWGWGAATPDTAIYFKSWREGIFTVTKGLRENYINKGLTNPYSMNRRYAKSPAWGSKVDFFMKDLEKFAREYEVKNLNKDEVDNKSQIAADSGQLTTE